MEQETKIPQGHHKMPNGTIMKDSEHYDDNESEYSCENPTCRKIHSGSYTSEYCSQECDDNSFADGGDVKDKKFTVRYYTNQYGNQKLVRNEDLTEIEVEKLKTDGRFKKGVFGDTIILDDVIEITESKHFSNGGSVNQWNVMYRKTKDSPFEYLNEEPVNSDTAKSIMRKFKDSGTPYHELVTHLDIGFADGGEILKTEENISSLNDILKKGNAGSVRFAYVDSKEIQYPSSYIDIDSEHYDDLTQEIKENGIVPILLNDNMGNRDGFNYSIWDGNHRFLILEKLGIRKIPAYIHSGGEFSDENNQMDFIDRYSNNSPLVKIDSYKQSFADGGSTDKSTMYFEQTEKLADMITEKLKTDSDISDNWHLHERNYTAKAVPLKSSKQKYIKLDLGSSGKYMVDVSNGAIYGIKAYGVINKQHVYGNIADYLNGNRKIKSNAISPLERTNSIHPMEKVSEVETSDYEKERQRQIEQGLTDAESEGISVLGMMKGKDNPVSKLREEEKKDEVIGKYYYDSRYDKPFQVISIDDNRMDIEYIDWKTKKREGITNINKNEFDYNTSKGVWGEWKQPFIEELSDSEEPKLVSFTKEALTFVPKHQRPIVSGAKEEFQDSIIRVNEAVSKMPVSYGTEGVATNDKIIYLHYFYGNMDWYIIEKDVSANSKDPDVVGGQIQAFGYVDMGSGGEWGYINIDELVNMGNVELDLYFTPKTFGELMGKEKEQELVEKETPSQEEYRKYNFGENSNSVGTKEYELTVQLGNLGAENIKNGNYDNSLFFEYGTHKFEIFDNGGEFKMDDLTTDDYMDVFYFTENGRDKTEKELAKEIMETAMDSIAVNEPIKTEVTAYDNPFLLNKAIERLIDEKGENPENYSPDEIEFINYYSGYGGLEKFGAEGKGLLYEYFTPLEVCKTMWALAYKYGYGTVGDGSVLEPSAGTGNFLKYAPQGVNVDAYEINPYSQQICKILNPQAEVSLRYFEENFIKSNESIKGKISDLPKYSLVIGNPPYGVVGGRYMGMGEKSYTKASNYTEYFITRGLDMLVSGGLLVYIVGAEQKNGGTLFLDSSPSKVKQIIFDKADMMDAYRLPVNIFERTGVSSEIIVFKKR